MVILNFLFLYFFFPTNFDDFKSFFYIKLTPDNLLLSSYLMISNFLYWDLELEWKKMAILIIYLSV